MSAVRGRVVETTRYGSVPLKMTVRVDRTVLRLRAAGRLDASTAPALVNLVHALVEPSCTEVHVDLAGVFEVDDAGTAELERCRRGVEADGRRFVVDDGGVLPLPA